MRPEDTEQNATSCICPGCPSHNECMKENGEVLYCSWGASPCDVNRHGCICGRCPVWSTYGLTDYYYCIIGAAE